MDQACMIRVGQSVLRAQGGVCPDLAILYIQKRGRHGTVLHAHRPRFQRLAGLGRAPRCAEGLG